MKWKKSFRTSEVLGWDYVNDYNQHFELDINV